MANERQRLTDEAERAARRGDLTAAAECYRQLLAITPDDLNLLQKQGDALARLGRSEDAREAFLQLARACEAAGHTSRSLAALRRASRLGTPKPELLEELGFRAVEAGLGADASEPLLEALRAYGEASDLSAARALSSRAGELLPREVALFEARVAIERELGAEEDRARACVDLALCHARLGKPESALAAIAEALGHDPLTPLVRQLDALCVGLGGIPPAKIPESLAGAGSAEAASSWSVVRAALLLRAGERDSAVRSLRSRLAVAGGPAPWLAVVLGRLLLEAGDVEAGDHAARFAVRGLSRQAQARGILVELLNLLVSKDPGREWAVSCLVRLDERKGKQQQGPSASSTPRADDGAPGSSGPAGFEIDTETSGTANAIPPGRDDLPDEIRARLFEAESLLEHGFGDTAARALQKIPAEFLDHVEVRKILNRIDSGGSAPEAAPGPADEQGLHSPPGPVGRETAEIRVPSGGELKAEPPMSGSARKRPATKFGAPDLDVLDEQIQALVPEADAETSYQMGIGFVEMGLGEQAIPLLEKALGHPSRAVDAALVVMRLLRESGASERAWSLGTRAFRIAQSDKDEARVELLAVLAETCFDLGRPSEAAVLVTKIESLDAGHPSLADLRVRLEASRS